MDPFPNAMTIAKLKKHKINIIEKIDNKFCFNIGHSNFNKFDQKPNLKDET